MSLVRRHSSIYYTEAVPGVQIWRYSIKQGFVLYNNKSNLQQMLAKTRKGFEDDSSCLFLNVVKYFP